MLSMNIIQVLPLGRFVHPRQIILPEENKTNKKKKKPKYFNILPLRLQHYIQGKSFFCKHQQETQVPILAIFDAFNIKSSEIHPK